MKANKLILAALTALLLASCDDDSNDDKIRIAGFANVNATVMVDVTDGTYQLYWESPIFFTNRNDAIGSPIVKYDVFVKQAGAFLAETKIATVEGSWLNIAADKVSDALDGAQDFEFVVRMADESLSNLVVYNSETLNINNAGNTSGDYLIAVTAVGEGEVTGGGWYDYGDPLVLTATPNSSDYRFVGWYDDETNILYSSDNPLKISVIEDMCLVAKFTSNIDWEKFMPPHSPSDADFNEWFTDGAASTDFEIVDNVAGEYYPACAVVVPKPGNDWDVEFCNILRGNKYQEAGAYFSFDCDVYWEKASDNDNDTADLRLLTGKIGWTGHEDWQWNAEENTELVTTNAGGFWGYVHNQGRKIPNKEWTHVSWGDELTIGEKGAEYIGIQINLDNTAGTNIGTFYFRNIKIKIGKRTLEWLPYP